MINKKSKIIKVIVPIYGLGWISNNVKLDKGIKIRFINELKKESELLKKSGFNWIKYNCVLNIRHAYNPEKTDEPYPALQFLLDKIQSSLRVFNPGFIEFSGIISKPQVSPFPMLFSYNPTAPLYKIDKDKLAKFPNFYQKFKIAYSKKKVAFDWFNKSYSEVPINKAIEYCICLENLFVPLNAREKKRFIIQGLKLLNFNQSEIDSIEILYNFRNSIIHADYQESLKMIEKYKIGKNFYDKCEKILRKTLELYIKNPW